jgi:hypothetical protein
MVAGPCVSLAKIRSVTENASSATLLGGQRRSLTGSPVVFALLVLRGGHPLMASLLRPLRGQGRPRAGAD